METSFSIARRTRSKSAQLGLRLRISQKRSTLLLHKSDYSCPDDRRSVRLHRSIVRHDNKLLDNGLREQHSIEGIGVMLRQNLHGRSVLESYRQLDEPAVVDAFGEGSRQANFSEA